MRIHGIAHAQELGMQIGFRTGFEQRRIHRARRPEIRLPQNVLNALEARGERLEVFGRTNGADRLQAPLDIHQIVGRRRQARRSLRRRQIREHR